MTEFEMSAEVAAAVECELMASDEFYCLPIKMFDTFEVTITIHKKVNNPKDVPPFVDFFFIMECDNIFDENGNPWELAKSYVYNVFGSNSAVWFPSVSACFEGLTKMLENGKFNKIDGKFKMPKESDDLSAKVAKVFQGSRFKRVKMSIEDCCVCGDATRTRTECGHFVCLSCVSQLECDDDDDERKCPMCRTKFNHCKRD